RRDARLVSDWSSDVCSSDLKGPDGQPAPAADASGVVVYLTGFTQDPTDEVPVVRQKFKSFILPDGRGGAFRALPITKGQWVDFRSGERRGRERGRVVERTWR